MGLLEWILRRPKLIQFAAGRGWTTDIVGELKYQNDLQAIYRALGGTEHDVKATAELIPERNNRFDPNAVRIEIGHRTVGYLTTQMASEYRAALGVASGQCSAKIVGGFIKEDGTRAYFGVKLNISWLPRAKINKP